MSTKKPEAATPLELAVGKQIVVELAEAEMTRQQLADAVDIERATLSRYLLGNRAMPMPVFFKVARVLGVDPQELLARAAARLSD